MAVLPTGIGPVTGGYQIERSLRFNSADSAYLSRTFGTPTNNLKWTMSMWVKRGVINSPRALFSAPFSGSSNFSIGFSASGSSASGDFINYHIPNVGSRPFVTSAVYRDTSAWYHFVFVFDSANATQADRFIIYVNGVRQAASTASVSLNQACAFNQSGVEGVIGKGSTGYGTASDYADGYMTEIYFVDGQALTPSDFGETDTNTGVWKPKTYSGTYGNNGFELNFSDNSNTTAATLGKDSSGNGNNWTPNNFSVTAGSGNDSLVDSPTAYGTDTGAGGSVRGNYATYNPLFRHPSTTYVATYSDGNLQASFASGAVAGAISSIGPTTGKWYAEFTCTAIGTNNADVNVSATNSPDQMQTSGEFLPGNYSYGVRYLSAGSLRTNNTNTSSWGSTWTTNDVIQVAVDCDTGKVWFGKNGTWQASGNPASGTSPAVTFSVSANTPYWMGAALNSGATMVSNFGQRAFAYTAPSGFKALCTTNLPTPTIGATSTTLAGKYFNPVLYTGTGSTRTVTGVGFQPDFTWIKPRSAADYHILYDAVRGVRKQLYTSLTSAEETETQGLSAFTSDGFTVNGAHTVRGQTNDNTVTYVAWNWNAGGSNVTNTSGNITSTVRANTTSGFSIISYTGNKTSGATIGHGLGVAPAMVIIKERANASEWIIYHTSIGATKSIYFTTAAENTNSIWFNNTAPSSTVITLGNSDGTNRANTMIAYAFAPVAGYSAFGSFTGNGNADGPFVHLGFRPAFVMAKLSSATGDWNIVDDNRQTYNDASGNPVLRANLSSAEEDVDTMQGQMDLLSNGFKLRSNNSSLNLNGGTIIYAAFAEFPFRYSLAR